MLNLKKILAFLLCVFTVKLQIEAKTCRRNEVLTNCGSACVETCETLTGLLPPPVCTKQCIVNVCRCRPGFVWRTSIDHTCVPEQYCYHNFNGPLNDPVFDPMTGIPANSEWSSSRPLVNPGPAMNNGQKHTGLYYDKPTSSAGTLPRNSGFRGSFSGPKPMNIPGVYPEEDSSSDDSKSLTYPPSTEGQCPINEVWSSCSGQCESTCANFLGLEPPMVCPAICREPGSCVCAPGYYRRSSTNFTCVTEEFCKLCENNLPGSYDIAILPYPNPPECGDNYDCPVNEQWSQCGGQCESTCATYLGTEPPKICPMYCRLPGSCICDAGYVRRSNTNSSCVPDKDCSSLENWPKSRCGKHEVWTNCGSSCQTTCAIHLGLELPKPCILMCIENSCECEPGYVRISDLNPTCVPVDSCSNYYPQTNPCSNNGCGENEYWSTCSEVCPETCENKLGLKPRVYCEGFICEANCDCQPGYMRISDTDFTCVAENTCSNYFPLVDPTPPPELSCGANETLTDCGSLCESICANTLGIEPVEDCFDMCIPNSCACKPGYLRVSKTNTNCVPEDSCYSYYPAGDPLPDCVCDDHEVWTDCTNACTPTCDTTLGLETEKNCDTSCLPGSCICEPGYLRVSQTNSTCVPENSCPLPYYPEEDECEQHETWQECPSMCQKTCANYLGHVMEELCIAMCNPDHCVCEPGFVKVSNDNSTCIAEQDCSYEYPEYESSLSTETTPTSTPVS